MSIVLYTIDQNGYHATISMDKFSSLYNVRITDKYGQVQKNSYMSMASAKRAIKRIINQ